MKKLLFLLFAAVFISLMAISCRSKENQINKHMELEKVKNYTTGDLINYMYEGCNKKKDFNALSRILKASPSSLERIRIGETMPTPEFVAEVRIVSTKYIHCGCSIYELRKSYNDLKWYEKFMWCNLPKWFKVLFYISDLILSLTLIKSDGKEGKGCLTTILILWLVLVILFSLPQRVDDKFINKIDKRVEYYMGL